MTTATVWDWDEGTRSMLGTFLFAAGLTRSSIRTSRIGDGHSNLTFLVTDGTHRVVVRRGPPPPTPAGAHDMMREARFLRALAGTGVPVPRVLAIAEAGEVIDVPFYVMSVADGPIVTDATPSQLAADHVRRQIGDSMVDTLAALHAVDWRPALGDLARPEGSNARQLRRMSGLVDDAPEFVELGEWLHSHVPVESGATIVHNDYRIGNLVLAPDRPGRVAAILDWELATVGDPLADLAYLVASVPIIGEPATPTQQLSAALTEPGYPTRDAMIDRYVERTGADLEGLRWHAVFALWRVAALYEYGRRRAARGGDAYFEDPELVRSFLAAAEREVTR